MAITATQFTLLCIFGIILLARPAQAFGAGNIGSTSKIEGENWRHGDLEDTFLTLVASKAMGGKKFSKLDVKRIYFGNWLRDYSQAVDVGTVKNISAEAIRVVLWILGFMSFGYGTKEFEVTTERLGCYRPEEHIDNPKDYADNEDARQYDRRLRAPIDEERELAIDPELGLKAYIASENLGIDTSAALVRKLFGRSIELGRRYARNKNEGDLYEALRLLGTGCHCLEDFSAHSNFTELALIELGERDIFPHVGRNCKVRLRGARSAVYPLVTGTFGGVDFLHSVTGEFDDKATQSEIQELEGTLQQAQQQGENSSVLQDLLQNLPDGIFGGKDEAGKADELKTNATEHAMANSQISPREPEEWLQYINDAQKQIYPIIEWHDEVMQSITETIEKIPVLPDMIEKIQEEVNIFVFSLLAPFMLPIISQIKTELNTGSSTIIQSSVEKQHIVFSDDDCSDPTHSMLSKDHFSNVLNEPAGKIAGQVLRWVVPQLIAAWDDEDIDTDQTLNRIIRGVFHHPALRQIGDDGADEGRAAMFAIVEDWWTNKSEREKDSLRDQLSRDGVEEGRNHKPGVRDHGHGSAKKLGMPNVYTANHQGAPGGFGGPSAGAAHTEAISQLGKSAGEAVGGGVLGSIVGGLTSAVGRGVVAGALGDQPENTQTYGNTTYGNDGTQTQNVSQVTGNRTTGNYGRTQYSRTDDQQGGRSQGYSSYQQQSDNNTYSSQTGHAEYSSYGGVSSENSRFGTNVPSSYGQQQETTSGYRSSELAGGRSAYNQRETSGGYGTQQPSSYGRRQGESEERPDHGRRRGDDDERQSHSRRNDDDNERSNHGRRNDSDDERPSHGRRNDDDNERSSYGRRDDNDDNQRSHGRRGNDSDNERSSYGRQQGTLSYNQGGYNQRSSYTSGGDGGNQRSDEDRSGGGYEQQIPSYGRTGGNEYGGRQESSYDSGRYGRGDNQEEHVSAGNYGGSRRRNNDDESESMPGGFGAEENDNASQRRAYGRRGDQNDENEGSYGGRRHGGYGN